MKKDTIKTIATVNETADFFGCPRYFVRRLAEEGKIVCFKSGNRYLINTEAFEEFLKRGENSNVME